MKKLILTVLAALSFTACVHEKMEKIAEPGAITFGNSFVAYTTKAAEITHDNLTGFDVWGYMDDDRTAVWAPIFESNQVRRSSGDVWNIYKTTDPETLEHKYWIPRKDYYFAGIAPMKNRSSEDNNIKVSFEQASNKIGGTINFTNLEGQEDLILSSAFIPGTEVGTSYDEKVNLTFNHLLSKVRVSFVNEVDPYIDIVVSNVKIQAQKTSTYNVSEGTWSIDNESEFGNYSYLDYSNLPLLTPSESGKTGTTESLFLIPSNKYSITFDVTLSMVDVNGDRKTLYTGNKSASVSATEISKITPGKSSLEKATSYNFVVKVTPQRVVSDDTFEIDDIKTEDWNAFNLASQISIASKLGGTITLTSDVVIPSTIDVVDDLTINLNGWKIEHTAASGYLFNVISNSNNITNNEDQITTLTIYGNENNNSKIISQSASGIATANERGCIMIDEGKFEAANSTNIMDVTNSGNIKIKRGKFLKWDPQKSNFVIEGSRSAKITEDEQEYFHVGIIIPVKEIKDDQETQKDPEQELKDALTNPFVDKVIIDDGCDIEYTGNSFNINHNVIIEGGTDDENSDVNAGSGTNRLYGFTIAGPYEVEIKNLDIVGGGIAAYSLTTGEKPKVKITDCTITTTHSSSGRNVIYAVDCIMEIINTDLTVTVASGTHYFYAGQGSEITVKNIDCRGSTRSDLNNGGPGVLTVYEGTFDINPTKYVAEGYKVTSSGKIYTVSAE